MAVSTATASVSSDYEVQLLCPTQCLLGEGPLYDPQTSTLHFVDIVRHQILHYNTVNHELTVDQFDKPISCLAFRSSGPGFAVAAGGGFALVEYEDGVPCLRYISEPLPKEQQPYTRFNDGACDPRGRFLAGTLFHKEEPYFNGSLYSYDPETQICKLLDSEDITDSNGLGWSQDGKILYFTNSFLNRIYAYDYDVDTGNVSNRRIFVDALAQGLPPGTFCDGLCFDDEGGSWSARWNGGCVARFRSDGTLDFTIPIPGALNVTACTFGGPNNDILYVTTARCGCIPGLGDPAEQEQYPNSGDLFLVDLKGRFHGGMWRHKFGG